MIELQIRPMWSYDQQKFTLESLREAVNCAAEHSYPAGNLLTSRDIRSAYFTNTSLRSMPDNELRMWQISRSGLFELLYQLPKTGIGSFEGLRSALEAALQKLAEIYRKLPVDGGEVKFILSVYDGMRQLADPYTEPSGRWEKVIKSSDIYSKDTAELLNNFSDYIL